MIILPHLFPTKTRNLDMITRTFLAWIIAIVFSFSCYALEVGDLHLPLTRSDADKTLTKDYHFEVLTDGTVRRIWRTANRTIAVDFDPVNDAAICITITYAKPVSRKTAEADADAMSPDTEAKWKKTKAAAVEKVGIPVGSSIKEFEDNSMMFLEAASAKKKYSAVSYHAKAPRKNRKELEPVADDQRTAMGSTSMAGNIKFLIKDEENRRSMPTQAVATKTASSETKPAASGGEDAETAASSVAVATPAKPTKPATPTPAKTPAPQPTASAGKEMVTIIGPNGVETVEGTVTTRTVTTGEDEEEYGNLLDVVKDKMTPVQMCIAGVVVLLLLFLIIASAARSRAKRRQKAKFAQILVSSPTNAAQVAAPRKKPVANKKD